MNIERLLRLLAENDEHKQHAMLARQLADDSENRDSAALAEVVAGLDEDVGDANPNHEPAGSRKGGQFAKKGGGKALGFKTWVLSVNAYKNAPKPTGVTGLSGVEANEVLAELEKKGRLNDDGTVSLFHVTTDDNVDVIKENGLIPGMSEATGQTWKADHSDYATYFFGNREQAQDQVDQAGGGFTVIEARIPITPLTLARVLPDEDMSTDPKDGIKTLIGGGSVAFIGGVPASALRFGKKTKDANPNHYPAGSRKGGQFAPKGNAAPGNTNADDVPTREQQVKAHDDLKNYLTMMENFRRERTPLPQGMDSVEGLLLKHGQPYFVNEKTYAGKRDTPKMCYMNATQAMIENPDRTYVEGYITTHGVPIAHAWTVDSSGQVYDSTIVPKGGRVAGYFGIPFANEYVLKSSLANKHYGLLGYVSRKTLIPLLEGKVDNFKKKVTGDANPYHEPAGSSKGGQFASKFGIKGLPVGHVDPGANADKYRNEVQQATGYSPEQLTGIISRDVPLEVTLEEIKVNNEAEYVPDGVTLTWRFRDKEDPENTVVGTLQRSWSDNGEFVSHDEFVLDDSYTGEGIGKTVLGNLMAAYQQNKVKKIHVEAGMVRGGYAWAKFGFTPIEIDFYMRSAIMKNAGFQNKKLIDELLTDDPKSIWKLADHPIGKQALRKVGWAGDLKLDDQEAMDRFYTYVNKENHPRDGFVGDGGRMLDESDIMLAIIEQVEGKASDANPNHEPAGSEKGGQFAHKAGGIAGEDPIEEEMFEPVSNRNAWETAAQAKTGFRQNHGFEIFNKNIFGTASAPDSDPDFVKRAKEIDKVLTDVKQQFPGIIGRENMQGGLYVGTDRLPLVSVSKEGITKDISGRYNLMQGKVELAGNLVNNSYMGLNPREVDKELWRLRRGRHGPNLVGKDIWNIDTHSLTTTFMHEYAHAIETKSYGSRIAFKVPRYHPAYQQDFWNNAAQDPAFKAPSRYSRTNGQEMWAESVAVYTHPMYERGMLDSRVEEYFDAIFRPRKKNASRTTLQ